MLPDSFVDRAVTNIIELPLSKLLARSMLFHRSRKIDASIQDKHTLAEMISNTVDIASIES